MRELVEVRLPSGATMWATVESDQEPRDVGFGEKFASLPGLPEIVEWVGSSMAAGLRRCQPDGVTAEFGVELAVGDKGLVAALGGVGATTKIKVTLPWGRASVEPDVPDAPDAPGSPAGSAPGSPAGNAPADEPR